MSRYNTQPHGPRAIRAILPPQLNCYPGSAPPHWEVVRDTTAAEKVCSAAKIAPMSGIF